MKKSTKGYAFSFDYLSTLYLRLIWPFINFNVKFLNLLIRMRERRNKKCICELCTCGNQRYHLRTSYLLPNNHSTSTLSRTNAIMHKDLSAIRAEIQLSLSQSWIIRKKWSKQKVKNRRTLPLSKNRKASFNFRNQKVTAILPSKEQQLITISLIASMTGKSSIWSTLK